jgi:dienelactone hydrolase
MRVTESALRPRRLSRRLSAPKDALAQRWALLSPTMEVARPAGPGPFPTVLMFHGCGGRRDFLKLYMDACAAAGVMAVSFDSLTPRAIGRTRALTTVCTGVELPGWERAGDVLAAIWAADRIPGVDPVRLGLMGWSHGGWAIMDLMTMALTKPGEAGIADPDPALLDRVKALVLAYPYCGPGALSQLRPWRRARDIFAFVGDRDSVAMPSLCRRALRTAERAGSTVELWHPAGVTHAFDEEGSGPFQRFRFDGEATSEAVRRSAAFLAERL